MRDFIFLSYFFPPMGGGAVQRALKFVKYLPACGWRPIVVAGRGDYHVFDETLAAEVPETAVVERVGEAVVVRRSALARGVRRLTKSFRKSLYFPDVYAGWGRSAYQACQNLLSRYDVKAVLSTAPPYTSHLIAAKVAAEASLPLVLDYRDAWADNPFDTWSGARRRERMRRAEDGVLARANALIAVTEGMAAAYRARVPSSCEVRVIANGFDAADFAGPAVTASGPFEIVYAGQFYDGRMPWAFLEGASLFARDRAPGGVPFRIRFIGPVGRGMINRVRSYGVDVEMTGPLGHAATIAAVRRADANLLIIGDQDGAEATLTGKIFEYLRAGKPVLALVPIAGEAAALIRECGAGEIVPPRDVDAIAGALGRIVEAGRKSLSTPPVSFLSRFERAGLAIELAGVLDRVV